VEINKNIEDLILELKKSYLKSIKVGKEKGIARFLLHLLHNNFLKE
jgi:hypothetical protein